MIISKIMLLSYYRNAFIYLMQIWIMTAQHFVYFGTIFNEYQAFRDKN